MLCDLVDGGGENTRGLSCSAKSLAQTNSAYKGQFLQIKRSNKTSIACEVNQFKLWQRELSITGFRGEISHLTISECSQINVLVRQQAVNC